MARGERCKAQWLIIVVVELIVYVFLFLYSFSKVRMKFSQKALCNLKAKRP